MMPKPDLLPPETVMARFVALTGTPRAMLTGPERTREISRRRQELMFLLSYLSPATCRQIGEMLGNRDGSTVSEGADVVVDRMAADPLYKARIVELTNAIRAGLLEAAATDSAVRGPRLAVLAARGVLADQSLSDADARVAALHLLAGGVHV